MQFLKKAFIVVFSLQAALISAQSASLVRSYLKSEKKIAQNLSPLVDTLDYHLDTEKWTPVFDRIVAGVDALTRGLKLAERRFEPKLPRYDSDDTKEIEADFLSFADEAVEVLATFTRKTRPAVLKNEEISKRAYGPFSNLEKSLKSYLPKLLDTIPTASEAVIISTQLLQDAVGGLVIIFEDAIGAEETLLVTTSGSGSVKIIIG